MSCTKFLDCIDSIALVVCPCLPNPQGYRALRDGEEDAMLLDTLDDFAPEDPVKHENECIAVRSSLQAQQRAVFDVLTLRGQAAYLLLTPLEVLWFWRCKSFDMGDYLMSGADYRSDVIVQMREEMVEMVLQEVTEPQGIIFKSFSAEQVEAYFGMTQTERIMAWVLSPTERETFMRTDTADRERLAMLCIFGDADAVEKKDIMTQMTGPQRLVFMAILKDETNSNSTTSTNSTLNGKLVNGDDGDGGGGGSGGGSSGGGGGSGGSLLAAHAISPARLSFVNKNAGSDNGSNGSRGGGGGGGGGGGDFPPPLPPARVLYNASPGSSDDSSPPPPLPPRVYSANAEGLQGAAATLLPTWAIASNEGDVDFAAAAARGRDVYRQSNLSNTAGAGSAGAVDSNNGGGSSSGHDGGGGDGGGGGGGDSGIGVTRADLLLRSKSAREADAAVGAGAAVKDAGGVIKAPSVMPDTYEDEDEGTDSGSDEPKHSEASPNVGSGSGHSTPSNELEEAPPPPPPRPSLKQDPFPYGDPYGDPDDEPNVPLVERIADFPGGMMALENGMHDGWAKKDKPEPAPVVAKVCTECKEPATGDAKFCPMCGADALEDRRPELWAMGIPVD